MIANAYVRYMKPASECISFM